MTYAKAHDIKTADLPKHLKVSRKRSASVRITDHHSFNTWSDFNWDGGSRPGYFLIDTSTGERDCPLRVKRTGFGERAENVDYDIPPGYALVECGTFCGKPRCPTYYVRPENADLFGLSPAGFEITA